MEYFDNHYGFGLRSFMCKLSVLYCVILLPFEHIVSNLFFMLLCLQGERGQSGIAQMPAPPIIASSIWLLGKNDYETFAVSGSFGDNGTIL